MTTQYYVTLIHENIVPKFNEYVLVKLKDAFSKLSCNLLNETLLSSTMPHCTQFLIEVLDITELEEELSPLKDQGLDLFLIKDTVYRKYKRLFVFDMDSTLIQQEVIDELGRFKGIKDQIEEITDKAMQGNIDFQESLRRRAMLLRGIQRSSLDHVKKTLSFNTGVEQTFVALRKLGIKTAVISGGFDYFTNYIKEKLTIDYSLANELIFDESGEATGEIGDVIVDGELKAITVEILAKQNNISKEQIVCVGDGANDIKMLNNACTLGIAYNAKKIVKDRTKYQLNYKNMIYILYLLGLNNKEIQALIE